MATLCFLYAFQYVKTTPKSYLFQIMLIAACLGTDWYENERFEPVFTKMLIFMAKTVFLLIKELRIR
jgi:hypothetical protein